MAIVVHPYIMGAPHRPKYFRKIFETSAQKPDVLFWTGSEISIRICRSGPKAP